MNRNNVFIKEGQNFNKNITTYHSHPEEKTLFFSKQDLEVLEKVDIKRMIIVSKNYDCIYKNKKVGLKHE